MATTTGTAPADAATVPVPTTVSEVPATTSTPTTAAAAADVSTAPAPAPVPVPAAEAVSAPVATTTTAAGDASATTITTTTTTAAPVDKTAESVTTKSPSTAAAKASSSTADEKAEPAKPTPAIPAPKAAPASKASSTPKKRRKRGGLASIFVALGCLSADEFDDDAPNKSKPPPKAAVKNNGSNPSAAAGSATTPKNGSSSNANPNGPSATAKTDASAKDIPKDANVADGVIIRSSEPTTAPLDETAGLTSGAVQAPGSGSEIIHQHMLHHRNDSEQHIATADANRTTDSGGYTDLSDSEGDDVGHHQEMLYDDDYEDEEDRLIAQGGIGIPLDENGNPAPLLPPLHEIDTGRKCLVLDLDETLLHSSFKMLPSADYIVPVEIESQTHNVYVIKRPGVDHFLQEMGKIYEVVVFTASLSKYADPVLDMLDVGRVVRHRLFRESCYNHKGNYVKDLSQLGREMSTAIIIDNSPASYIFHPNNAVPVSTWFNDPHDTELTDLCPFLTDLATVDDVRGVLDGSI